MPSRIMKTTKEKGPSSIIDNFLHIIYSKSVLSSIIGSYRLVLVDSQEKQNKTLYYTGDTLLPRTTQQQWHLLL